MINYRQVREYHQKQSRKPPPSRGSQIVVMGFAFIILAGTCLLKLPFATEPGTNLSWLEALFTATSATTVTGLSVVNVQNSYTTFGELVILGLIQVGGVGFIIISVILFRLIGRRFTFFERDLMRQNLGIETAEGVVKLTRTVFRVVISIELVGAAIIFSQWVKVMPWPDALYFAIFHSISAFCNAGFDLFTGLDDPILVYTTTNSTILMVLSTLITLGTLGLVVVYDLVVNWPRQGYVSLHTRLVFPLTMLLNILGTFFVMIDELYVAGHAMPNLTLFQHTMLAFFTIVSSRTAGVTLIPMDALGQTSQLIIFIWMFIGGAPASMGGGIGLSTVSVVMVTLYANVLGYPDVRIFERTLPTETILKAVAIMTVSTLLVATVTLLMMLFNQGTVFAVAFEVISAFSNTGYSLGITSNFTTSGRLFLIFTMFWGRLGPLTLVVALAQRRYQTLIKYPEEKIILG